MNQLLMLAAIRTELQDTDQDQFENDELIRAVDKSLSLMSRLIPKRAITETTLARSITSETLTIATSTGTLAYKPIKVDSLVITGKTLDTDYRVNYLTGVVTEIGALLPDTTYQATYELDSSLLDLSTFLTDYIKIERVEYPVGQTPTSNLTFDQYGNILAFRGTVTLATNDHIRIVYLAKWTAPTSTTAGDYPSHLDDALIIGSVGQALIYKAEQYTQLAASTTSDIITLLDTIPAMYTAVTLPTLTAPTAPTLATAPTPITISTGSAPSAYTISAPSAPTIAAVPSAPSAYTPSYTAATDEFTSVLTELHSYSTLNADGLLDSGVALINSATRGDAVGATYGTYANVKVNMAQTILNTGIARLKQIETDVNNYQAKVTAFGSEVNAYANKISGDVGKYREEINAQSLGVTNAGSSANVFQSVVSAEQAKANVYQSEVSSYNATVSAQVNKFQSEVSQYQNLVAASQFLMGKYTSQATTTIQQATSMATMSTSYLDIAGRYLASGQAKINEMLVMLGLKPEFNMNKASSEQR
jgi:hypothetical protein